MNLKWNFNISEHRYLITSFIYQAEIFYVCSYCSKFDFSPIFYFT